MPRKAPTQVIEHRMSLSNFERQQLEQFFEVYKKDKFAENIPNYLIGVAGLGLGAASIWAAHALWVFVNNLPIDEAKGWFNTLGTQLFGTGFGYVFNAAT